MIEKLWEVRSTNITILRTYVKAYTRDDAKRKAQEMKWEEIRSEANLTANQAWYAAVESVSQSNVDHMEVK